MDKRGTTELGVEGEGEGVEEEGGGRDDRARGGGKECLSARYIVAAVKNEKKNDGKSKNRRLRT